MPKALGPPPPRRRLLFVSDWQDWSEVLELGVDHKLFRIRRLTDTVKHRNAANTLINKMYSWRGYVAPNLPAGTTFPWSPLNTITL